jgi:hypothetical protein
MDAKNFFNGMMLLTIIAILAGSACAATPTAAYGTATTLAQRLAPTNMVLDYDLTRVDANLKAGDSGLLTVVIKNVGTQAAENVMVNIPGTGDISVNKKFDVGRVEPLASKTVSVTIAVSKNAYVGLHTTSIRISYDGYNEAGERKNDQLTVWDFPIRIYGNANFQITLEKGDFFKDISTKLVIRGTNQDGARSVTATLVPASSVISSAAGAGTSAPSAAGSTVCASVIGSSKMFVGDLGTGGSFKLEYMIQPGDVGVCSFGLLLDYYDVSGNALKETVPIGIEVQRYDVDFKVTDVSYSGASPGSTINITLTLQNVGSAAAKDASVTINFNAPFTAIGSSEMYVGPYNSKESKELIFKASVDSTADIKAYNIPVAIDYFDMAGLKHTIPKSIGIQVDGKPEIKAFLEKTDLFTEGTKGKITVTVVNKGFAQVKFLNLKLLSTENYDVTSSTEAYIGNLDSDATDSQEFEIQLKSNATDGKIPLRFDITYKEQNSNIDHVDPVNLELSVLSMQEYTQKQPTGNPVSLLLTVAGGIIGAVFAIIIIWFLLKLIGAVIGFLDSKLFKKKG